jgi:hypothetical protein
MGNRWRENKRSCQQIALWSGSSLWASWPTGRLARPIAGSPAICQPAERTFVWILAYSPIWCQRSILCINLVFPASISPQKVTNHGYVPESLTVTCIITLLVYTLYLAMPLSARYKQAFLPLSWLRHNSFLHFRRHGGRHRSPSRPTKKTRPTAQKEHTDRHKANRPPKQQNRPGR